MGRRPSTGTITPWDPLYELAGDQAGYFSTSQARELGFTTARLQYHVNTGKLLRATRGVLRLRHYPSSPLEEYVVLWLWSDREGIFSHETALMLHDLSDALPVKVHLTLPKAWEKRRLRAPPELHLHFADVPEDSRTWKDHVPITTPARSIEDCVRDDVSPDLLAEAIREATDRGLISRSASRRLGPRR